MKASIVLLSFVVFCFIIFSVSCVKENEEELYPIEESLDTLIQVSYATDVVPILDAACYACHDASSYRGIGGGVQLDDYERLLISVNNNKLLGSINRDGTASFMPRNASKLDQNAINTITNWINQGALNN